MRSITFHAQCYLGVWNADIPFHGGFVERQRLKGFRLDYSWHSLHRIDAFLSELRALIGPCPEAFLDAQSSANLLYLLAFYVGELRARAAQVPAQWVGWEQALDHNPALRGFGEGFHNRIVQTQPGPFLPLVAIVERLFDGSNAKSVALSAGVGLVRAAVTRSMPIDQPLPPVPSQSLIDDFPATFKRLPTERRMEYLDPDWPAWLKTDPLDRQRKDLPLLLGKGRVVWAAVVQANKGLFSGTVPGAPMEVLYDPRGMEPRESLQMLAPKLYELKGKKFDHPELQKYANYLENEVDRMFGWSVPTHWYPYPLLTTQLFVDMKLMLGKRLTSGLVPILICDGCPGSATVAPWDVWPAQIHAEWAEGWKPLAAT